MPLASNGILTPVCHSKARIVQRSINGEAPSSHCVANVSANTPLELSYEVPKHRPMGFIEFVVVIAVIMALNPLAMDIMLPALPNIGSTFHVEAPNRLQMVLTAFLIGFGAGQVIIGPLSDISVAARCRSAA
jgi:DHA1 family bicyclomycin/chloramphenicol resistance-like MFS transporter